MLVVRDLYVSHGATQALRGVSLRLSPGKISCVLGPNGAGKSTLINTISGLLRQDRGEIVFEGSPIDRLSVVERTQMGIVQCPEGRRLFETLTVGENLRLGAISRGRAWRKAVTDLEWLAALFPIIRERWRQQAGTLSGGEQQMIALARSLIAQPRLLLLDEPALGLSPRLVRQVFTTLPPLTQRGVTILLVEQNARAALQVANDGFLLRTGLVAMEGSAGALLAHLEQNAGYLGSSVPASKPTENHDGKICELRR